MARTVSIRGAQGAAPLHAADQQLAFVDEFLGEVRSQVEKQLFVGQDFLAPRLAIEGLQFVEFLLRKTKTGPVDVVVARHPADGRLSGDAVPVGPGDDPLEHAQVFAEAGPEEIPVLVLAKPVHVEDARQFGDAPLHADPMAEIVAHVVAAEGQHGHGVPADLAHRTGGGGGHLAAHGRAGIHTADPVEGLVDQRHGGRAPAAEDDRGDRHALGVLPVRIDRGALRGGRGET